MVDSIKIKYDLIRIQNLIELCNDELKHWEQTKKDLIEKKTEYERAKQLLS